MLKIVLAAGIAAAAITLNGCSGGSEEVTDSTADGAGSMPEVAGRATEATTAEVGAALDANTVTSEQLAGASGVSPELAEVIVAGRPYATVVDLNTKLRETLSEEAAGAVLQNVFVPVNLNSASREEIELIPGMTDRMVGEFLEYRPYENMNEFNREIGKYVDEVEVARFRRYVTL